MLKHTDFYIKDEYKEKFSAFFWEEYGLLVEVNKEEEHAT